MGGNLSAVLWLQRHLEKFLLLEPAELSCQLSEENCERREAFWAEWKDLTLSTRPEEG